MASNISIEFEGAAELSKALKELEPKVRRRLVRSAFKKAGATVLQAAKQNAPVKSGALRDSLVAKVSVTKKKIEARVETKDGLFQGDEFYGAFVELGTSEAPAHPFIRPALTANEGRIREDIITDVQKGVDEAMQK